MIKTLIVATVLLLGAPWAKNIDKLEPPEMETPTCAAVVEAVEPEEAVAENATTDEWTHSASMTVTHYCSCARCCGKWAGSPTASGAWPEAGRTVAVDPAVIPLGSEVLIGDHVYTAEDTGVSGYWVDIFCDSHQEALNRGMYTTEVCWR